MRLGAPYYFGEWAIDDNSDVEAAIWSGFALLKANDLGLRAVVTPRGAALRFLLEADAAGRRQPPIAICSRQRLSALIRARSGAEVARSAAFELGESDPSLTASTGLSLAQIVVAATFAGLAVGLWLRAPDLLRSLTTVALWLVFAAAIWLRSSVAVAAREPPVCEPLRDDELPIYTVIVALYEESGVVRALIRALDALDYPRAKLDIKLVVERRDAETLTAIASLRLPSRYDVIVAPPGAPSTKPRALNVALDAARGDLIVIYDAEDEPDPRTIASRGCAVRRRPGNRRVASAPDDSQRGRWLVERVVRDRICGAVRFHQPRTGGARLADRVGRNLQSFPNPDAAPRRRLGCVERDGGRRSRPPFGALWRPGRSPRVRHVGRGAERFEQLVPATRALAEGLVADADRPFTASHPFRTRTGRPSRPGGRRR